MGDSEITKDPTQKQDQTPPQQESSLGREYIGLGGVIAIMAYLVLFAVADLYVLTKVWPPALSQSSTQTTEKTSAPNTASTSSPTTARTAAAAASPSPSPSPSPASDNQKPPAAGPDTNPTTGTGASQKQTSTSEQDQGPWPVKLFWWSACSITLNLALFLIVILSGAMGSLVRALRSFYWYTGMRQLKWSWAAMYLLLPFVGALLAVVFYLAVRGGFSSTVNITSAYGYAAVGALVGLFSEQAILQLKQIADKILVKPAPGTDAAPQHTTAPPPPAPPKISGITPTTGPSAGATSATLRGDNFSQGAKVNFGGIVAIVGVITSGTIAVTTPAHATGAVDVEVINPDGKSDVLRGGFTYQ